MSLLPLGPETARTPITPSLSHRRPGTTTHTQGHPSGGHDKHAGHDPEMFRRRFWLCLVLTVLSVVTSEMVMDWFRYSIDFYGMGWVAGVGARSCSSGAAGRSWPGAWASCGIASRG
jgi:hypothetical protein